MIITNQAWRALFSRPGLHIRAMEDPMPPLTDVSFPTKLAITPDPRVAARWPRPGAPAPRRGATRAQRALAAGLLALQLAVVGGQVVHDRPARAGAAAPPAAPAPFRPADIG